jgi:hypothetical protein
VDLATQQARFTGLVLGDAYDAAVEDRIRSRDRIIGDRDFINRIRGLHALNKPVSVPVARSAVIEIAP